MDAVNLITSIGLAFLNGMGLGGLLPVFAIGMFFLILLTFFIDRLTKH